MDRKAQEWRKKAGAQAPWAFAHPAGGGPCPQDIYGQKNGNWFGGFSENDTVRSPFCSSGSGRSWTSKVKLLFSSMHVCMCRVVCMHVCMCKVVCVRIYM